MVAELSRGIGAMRGNHRASLACLAIAFIASLSSTSASASLIGTSWHVDYYFPNTATLYAGSVEMPNDFVVGAGVESVIDVEGILKIEIDFTADGIHVFYDKQTSYNSQWQAAAFSGLIFTFLDPGPLPFSSLIATPQVYMPGFDNSRITLTGDGFAFNWQGLAYDPNNPSQDGDGLAVSVQAVPEPPGLALVLLGLVGLCMLRLRRPLRTTFLPRQSVTDYCVQLIVARSPI